MLANRFVLPKKLLDFNLLPKAAELGLFISASHRVNKS
jgi:hypothetical protein